MLEHTREKPGLDLLLAQPQLRWHSANPFSLSECPRSLRPLLCQQQSLTRAVRSALGGQLRVRLLQQGWHMLAGQIVQQPGRHYMLARRLCMLHGQALALDALSLLPAQALRGSLKPLRQLGHKALGDALFSGMVSTQRSQIEVAHDTQHWWRRSQLHIHGNSIFLVERFPTAFWHQQAQA